MDYKNRMTKDGVARILMDLEGFKANEKIIKSVGKKLMDEDFQGENKSLLRAICNGAVECKLVDNPSLFDTAITNMDMETIRNDSLVLSIKESTVIHGYVTVGAIEYKDDVHGPRRKIGLKATKETNFDLTAPAIVAVGTFDYNSNDMDVYPTCWEIIYYPGENTTDKDREIRREFNSILEKYGI